MRRALFLSSLAILLTSSSAGGRCVYCFTPEPPLVDACIDELPAGYFACMVFMDECFTIGEEDCCSNPQICPPPEDLAVLADGSTVPAALYTPTARAARLVSTYSGRQAVSCGGIVLAREFTEHARRFVETMTREVAI